MTGGRSDGLTRVPLFPLGLVLFPGTQLPLHIFEPRYRAMLADVRAADGRFGIVLRAGDDERAIPRGYVGCYAIVREAVPLGDGRSNVLVDAGERFAVDRLIDAGTPYYVAEVRPFRDEAVRDPIALADAASRARAAFARVLGAARALADEPAAEVAPLPDDDAAVAFAVAAAVELELTTRQRVLASPEPAERTAYVARLLERAVPDVEARAELHGRARSNGHGPHDAPDATA
ncbi:peptidase [Gemmatimonadetes bacterium T265]|nr:peptidase [Gemmatimonadetes bacterium T265]